MHSTSLTFAMRSTLKDQSRVQRHHNDQLEITTHQISRDDHAKNFTTKIKMPNPELCAEIELARILPKRRKHEILCSSCFMIHMTTFDCS